MVLISSPMHKSPLRPRTSPMSEPETQEESGLPEATQPGLLTPHTAQAPVGGGGSGTPPALWVQHLSPCR